MSSTAERLPLIRRFRGAGGVVGLCLWLAPGVVLGLLLAKVFWHVPSELLATLGAGFLLFGSIVWLRGRWSSPGTANRAFFWIVGWLVSSALLLGAVHRVDRAGWVWYRLTGYDLVVAEDFAGAVELDRDSFLARHPAFAPDGASGLLLSRGTHDLPDTVIVPRNTRLRIEPGAVLRLGPGRSLVSYGPVTARGTAAHPVRFTSRWPGLTWGVVAVVGAERSIFEHVQLDRGRRALVNGIHLPGALSLIESDADIRDSRFVRLYGKDGVYVRASDVSIRDNLFQDVHKDGLDLDGGTGEVRGNRFVDCRDEGIDLNADARALVVENEILDSRGGRIAAEKDLEVLRSRNRLGYPDGASR